nr:MAG TPA: Rapamycin-insensitive companion of mTOR, domain 5 [Caudoviricetes sp.]
MRATLWCVSHPLSVPAGEGFFYFIFFHFGNSCLY